LNLSLCTTSSEHYFTICSVRYVRSLLLYHLVLMMLQCLLCYVIFVKCALCIIFSVGTCQCPRICVSSWTFVSNKSICMCIYIYIYIYIYMTIAFAPRAPTLPLRQEKLATPMAQLSPFFPVAPHLLLITPLHPF